MAASIDLNDPLIMGVLLIGVSLGIVLPVVYLLARRKRLDKEARLLRLQEDRRLRKEGKHPEQLQARSGVTAAYNAAKASENADRERLAPLVATQRPEPIGPQGPSADGTGPRLVATTPPGGERVGGPVRLRADQTEDFAAPVVDREAPVTASIPTARPIAAAAPAASTPPIAPAARPIPVGVTAARSAAARPAATDSDEELATLLSTLEDLSH